MGKFRSLQSGVCTLEFRKPTKTSQRKQFYQLRVQWNRWSTFRSFEKMTVFRRLRHFPESGESFRRSLFPGSLRGAFSGGQRIFRRSPFGLIWRAFSGVRRAFPEWPCFGGSEDPTFRNAIFRSWTPDFFIIGAIFRSPEASLSASTTGKLITGHIGVFSENLRGMQWTSLILYRQYSYTSYPIPES